MLVYAAAALGTEHRGWVRRLEEQVEDLSPSSRAYLGAALGALGESKRALAVIEERAAASVVEAAASLGSTRYLEAPVKTVALELRTLLAIDPHHPGVQRRVAMLEAERSTSTGHWRNTVENAAALAALAKYAQVLPAAAADWEVEIDAAGGPVTATSGSEWALALAQNLAEVEIDVQGSGPVFVSLHGSGRVAIDAGGLDRGLRCRRRFFGPSGAALNLASVKHGDLVFVEVELSTDGRGAVADVAVVDPLPGGFEVETPKLLQRLPWDDADDASGARLQRLREGTADRVEFLDDRVLIYATAAREPVAFRYAVRAVAAGVFEYGPIQAEAMYAPEVSSLGDPTLRVRVQR